MEDFDNLIKIQSQCPKYKKLYMLSLNGAGYRQYMPVPNRISDCITSGSCIIYNERTQAISRKCIYRDTRDQLYVRHSGRKILLEEFTCQQD